MSTTTPRAGVMDASVPRLLIDEHDIRRMRFGLALLWQAHDYAVLSGQSQWDYAVELGSLTDAGLSRNDLRLLMYQGMLEHALELKRLDQTTRVFETSDSLALTSRSCFILTDKSRDAFGDYRTMFREAMTPNPSPLPAQESMYAGSGPSVLPSWNEQLHELTLGAQIVKTFKLPAPNQVTVLTVFEEEGWPRHIDDPLPLVPELDPKRRLHDTIKSLNRNQKCRLLRFSGDGTGQGICWSHYTSQPC